jgi:hypothetical protein
MTARLAQYKMKPADFERRVKEQDGLCAICLNSRVLVIDHNHDTDKVRGLLCENCNRGLGFFRDCVLILESAIAYLQERD